MSAFNIGGLTAYVPQIDQKLFTQAVGGAATAKDLIAAGSVVFGKGRTAIRKMDLAANFQSGDDSCARNPVGDVTLTDTYFDIVRIKDEKNLCFQDLENTYYQLLVNGSIQPSEEGPTADFLDAIVTLRVSRLAEANEKALWIGNTGLTSSYGSDYTNYNKFSGIIKQVADGSPISMTFSGGSGIVAKLQNAFLSVPVALRSSVDFRIAVGQDIFDMYKAAIASTAATIGTPQDNTVFGTSAKFWVVPGLNGTNKIYGIRLGNIRLGMASQNDMDKVELQYIKDSVFHGFTSDVYFSIGVKVIDITEVGYILYV